MERGVGRLTRLLLLSFLLVLAAGVSSAWAASSGARVVLHAPRRVAADGMVVLSGTVPRVAPGSRVSVQRRSGAGWVVAAAGRVAKHGRFELAWVSPPKAAVVWVRVVGYRGNKLVGASRVRRVVVSRRTGPVVLVSSRTQVLAASTVVSASAAGTRGSLVFAGGNDVSVGQIIAIGGGPATPDGFLGQVTGVSVSGGKTTVQTKPATLMQAVPTGSFDVSVSQAPEGNSVRRGSERAHDSHVNCGGSVSGSVDADASVGLTITAKADWSLLHGVQSASLAASASASASVTATVEGAGSCKLDPVQILKLKGPGDTFFVGPVPVVVTSQLLVDLDASASVGAKVTTGISGGYSATAGIGWTKSGGFYPIDSFGPTFKYTAPTLSANADVEASLDPTIQVSLDGGGHANLNLSAGLDLSADTTANPWWALTAPVSVTGDLDISKLDLQSPTLTLYKHSFDLAKAGGPFGGTGGGTGGGGGSGGTGSPGFSITSSPTPAADAGLAAVSCVSSTDCWAVGSTGGDRTLIEQLNGSVWTIVSSPNPSGNEGAFLSGVSCVSASDCTAVGTYNNGSSGLSQTLVEQWDGTRWSIISSPNPSSNGALLDAVSCVSTSACIAVGELQESGYDGVTLIEKWDGSSWSIVTSTNPSGTENAGAYLNGVSCVSASDCVAVGDWYPDSGGGYSQTLIETLNGSAWSVADSPSPGTPGLLELFGVSCFSASGCLTTGTIWTGGNSATAQTFAEQSNGADWSLADPQTPADSEDVENLNAVSCVSADDCTAVGNYYNESAEATETLAEQWNGSDWSIIDSANPPASDNASLTGVSCGAAYCVAVGSDFENGLTLTEQEEGTS
jgi:hypothetical protein